MAQPHHLIALPVAAKNVEQPIPVEVHEQPETPLQAALEVLELVAEPLTTLGIVLLFVILVLLKREEVLPLANDVRVAAGEHDERGSHCCRIEDAWRDRVDRRPACERREDARERALMLRKRNTGYRNGPAAPGVRRLLPRSIG